MTTILAFLCLALQDSPNKDLQDLKERVDQLEKENEEIKKRLAQTTSANPETVLNPRVTVVGNTLLRMDDKTVLNEEGKAIDDTFNLREVELDLRASIDPYADAVAVLSLESEFSGEFETGVEEFLIRIKSLPLPGWEEPPLGAQITLGRMRTAFGTNNVLHLHDLPQSNRPLVIEDYLGEEGHVANGASVRVFLPSPGDSALQFTVQAVQGGGVEVAQDAGHPAYLANAHLFVPLAEEHSLDASLIGFYGTNDEKGHRQSRVWSLDAWYRWKPLRQGEYNSFLVGAQVFKLDHEFNEDIDTDADGIPDATGARHSQPLGYTVWSQYQLSSRVYLGARFDDAEFLADDSLDHRKLQPYLSWYLSEFFRARLSYERLWSDDDEEDGRNTFLFEVNVVFGAHPPEPFWVNK